MLPTTSFILFLISIHNPSKCKPVVPVAIAAITCEPGGKRRWCPPMPGLPVPMLRPGGRARPRGGKDGYGGRAGGGTGHGSVESESWKKYT